MIEQVRKKCPYGFLIMICAVIAALYVCFVKLLVLDLEPWNKTMRLLFLVGYHILVFLLVWSLFMTIKKDPGLVPTHWGFSMQERAKKYCLICHVFKPERTHHCSACNRCVLNMDHHCPWINGCIGFYNRKPFILMLVYTILLTVVNMITFLSCIPTVISKLNESDTSVIVHVILVGIGVILNCVIFGTILMFLKFHIELILNNYTTIETLELKRQNKQFQHVPSPYDIGKYYNWVQVFGKNTWTWGIPIFLRDQGPSGDGVIWPKRSTEQ